MELNKKLSIPLRFAFYIKQGFLWFIGRHQRPRKPVPDIARAFLVLVSSFGSMISINLVLEYGDAFKHRNSPLLPQWAATIILTNNYLESPFGQPLPLLLGTIISSVIGTGLTKIFMLSHVGQDHLWICGIVATALSSIAMSLTGTLHPAAASSAFLCAMNKQVRENLGWFYLVDQIVLFLITIGFACLFGNMYTKYPLYWLLPPRLETTKSNTPFPPWLKIIFDHLHHQEKNHVTGLSKSSQVADIPTEDYPNSCSGDLGEYNQNESPTRDYGDYGDYTDTDMYSEEEYHTYQTKTRDEREGFS